MNGVSRAWLSMDRGWIRGAKLCIAAVIALPVIVGCARPAEREAAADPAVAAAEFRWEAGQTYRALNMESCEGDPALRRAVVLASERQAVRAFEARMSATPLAFHLEVARGDALYALAAERGCWSDSDPRFARSHVQMARRQASVGLARMEELAPALAASLPMMAAPAPASARFRHRIRRLVEGSLALCPISTRAENDEIMAPARRELLRFRNRLKGTPHAVHYAFAEADAAYYWSIATVDCVDPTARAPAEMTSNALAFIRREIAAVEAGM